MTQNELAMPIGTRVYGLGMMVLGLTCVAFGKFDPGQPVPQHFPFRTSLAYVAGGFIVLSAAAIQWRRLASWGAAALTGYYLIFVLLLMNGRLLFAHYTVYGSYEEFSMQMAIAASGLIIYVRTIQVDGQINARLASALLRIAQVAFGICTMIWGGAHFVYMNLTAPLVPKWLPPGQVFWGYVTGFCFVAAGLAILTGVNAGLAAVLLTAMIASFGLLANGPLLLANPASHWNWTESALNLALTGASWVVAEWLVQGIGEPGVLDKPHSVF